MKSIEIYFRNVVRRWQSVARARSERIWVLMPYITSSTADTVLGDADPHFCEIYTVFSTENFANGSSSLRTIKSLHNKGFHLHHLPHLHAKAVIVSGIFASIGSQNLTVQGAKNREATVVFTSNNDVSKIEFLAKLWIENAQRISIEMIQQMEKLLPALVKECRKVRKAAIEIDSRIFSLKAQRLEQLRLEKEHFENEHLRRTGEHISGLHRLHQLRESISKVPIASEVIYGRVKEKHFERDGDRHFTKWVSDSRNIQLDWLDHYLCILPRTGKVGWVRLCDTRLSFIKSSIRFSRVSDRIQCGSYNYDATVTSHWNDPVAAGYNLSFEFKCLDNSSHWNSRAWLNADSLEIVASNFKGSGLGQQKYLQNWIFEHENDFTHRLRELIFSHFRLERNLAGFEAARFFGNDRHKVTLGKSPLGNAFLVAARCD